MKILVTGASGFVGSHLIERFLDSGHIVYALVRSPLKLAHLSHPNLNVIQGDLNLHELPWVHSLPQDLNACVHTAGIVHSYDHEEFDRVNHLATNILVKSLQTKFSSQFKFVFISSLAASGPNLADDPKNEMQPDFPVSAYGKSKKDAEIDLKKIAPQEWTLSVIRPPMVIGPRDTAVLDIFKMVQGGFILLPGTDSRKKQYSFVCVYDLVETIYRVTESDQSHFLYSAHSQVIKFEDMILEIKKQMHKRWHFYLPVPLIVIRFLAKILWLIWRLFPHNIRLTPDKIFELEAKGWVCDATESRLQLNQNYNYDFSSTVEVTLADYQARGWL